MISFRCKHCPQLFTSLLLIPEDAIAETSISFTQHLVRLHPEAHKQTAQQHQLLAAITTWLVIHCNNTDIMNDERIDDENNKYMRQQVANVIGQVGKIIGVDLIVETDGDDGDDNGVDESDSLADDIIDELDDTEDGYDENKVESIPILPRLKPDIN